MWVTIIYLHLIFKATDEIYPWFGHYLIFVKYLRKKIICAIAKLFFLNKYSLVCFVTVHLILP